MLHDDMRLPGHLFVRRTVDYLMVVYNSADETPAEWEVARVHDHAQAVMAEQERITGAPVRRILVSINGKESILYRDANIPPKDIPTTEQAR